MAAKARRARIPIVRAMVMRSTVTESRAVRLLWYVTRTPALLPFAVRSILYAQQSAGEDPAPPPDLVKVKDDLCVVENAKAA
jgi:hypothetical protein